jgi:protein-disulfide isomerase
LSILAWIVTPTFNMEAAHSSGSTLPDRDATLAPARSPLDLRDRPVLGVETAGIVVVEVTSFKCSHCRTFHETVFPTLRRRYIETGKVQWVVLNASDDAGEQSDKIYAVARCALRQDKYWEILDSLFQLANRPSSRLEAMILTNPLIDRGKMEICLREQTIRNTVVRDFAEYSRLKVRGTPTFLITKIARNGQRTETTIAGAQTLEYFQRVLEELLKTP